MEHELIDLAEKELRQPFKKLKVEIVRQSIPSLLVCGADPLLICNKKSFADAIIKNTNYDLKGCVLPSFILIAIISAVVQWLVTRWLDGHF